MGRLVIDGNSVYEIDEECLKKKQQENGQREVKQDEPGDSMDTLDGSI